MELVWKRLLLVIQDITARCEQLTGLARQLREAVNREQIQKVAELAIAQENELRTLAGLEQERAALLKSLQQELKLPEQPLNSGTLLQRVPPEWSNSYRLHIDQLRQRMEEMRTENEINGKLLRRSQQFVSWLVNYLVTPEGAGGLYNAAGSTQPRSYYHVVNQNL